MLPKAVLGDQALLTNALLQNYPDLDKSAAQSLMDAGSMMDIPSGQTLFTSCHSCHGVMWLLEGCVRVHRQASDGRELTLYRVTPGDLCVMSLYTLFHGGVYAAEAQSESRLVGLAVSPQKMLDLIERVPSLRYLLLKHLTARLHTLVELVSAHTFDRLELRLACLLGQRFSSTADVSITHQQLANDLGCAREVVSRLLKDFERMGCIRLHRGHIELLSQEALDRLTEPGT